MTRRATRAVVAALLTVPASAVLVTAAPSALAASSITTPAAGTVYTSGTSTTVSADLDPCVETTTLRVVNPQNDNSWTFTSSRPSGCDNVVNKPTTRRKPSVTPSWTATMPNGRFTVTLSGGVSATRYFYTSLAPSTPGGLTAKGTGASRVDLAWSYAGQEPDLEGFELSDGSTTTKLGKNVCSGGSCATTVYYSNPEPGTYPYSFTVRALRTNGEGTGTVAGDRSNAATAELVTPQPPPPPPSPTPTPTPSAGGGSGGGSTPGPGTSPAPGGGSTAGPGPSGGTGGTSGGGTGGTSSPKPGSKVKTPTLSIPSLNPVVAQRRSYALGFNNFSPSLGIPKLPPLPATTFSAEGGGFQPTLPYDARTATAEESETVLGAPIAAVKALDGQQLAKSLAFALILLGAAAHMRLFLRDHGSD